MLAQLVKSDGKPDAARIANLARGRLRKKISDAHRGPRRHAPITASHSKAGWTTSPCWSG